MPKLRGVCDLGVHATVGLWSDAERRAPAGVRTKMICASRQLGKRARRLFWCALPLQCADRVHAGRDRVHPLLGGMHWMRAVDALDSAGPGESADCVCWNDPQAEQVARAGGAGRKGEGAGQAERAGMLNVLDDLSSEETAFFECHARAEALPLYEALRARLAAELPDTGLRVQKTQITLAAPRVYGAVSFLPARRAAERPPVFITLTFGLGRREASSRIDQATEPYPGRWTHHVLIGDAAQLDAELMGWLAEAHDFAKAK